MEQVFNQKQKAAVFHDKGPMMVLAGPGSGKTTVIIHRVRELIERRKVMSFEILVITFTKAAAEEMKERFLALGVLGGNRVSFSTFHGFFFRILREAYGYTLKQILSEEEKWNALRRIVKDNNIEVNDEEEFIRDFLSEVTQMKNELLNPKVTKPSRMTQDEFSWLYDAYENYKRQAEKIDFDDMLVQCYLLLRDNETVREQWQNKYPYLLVDEFQDINQAQYQCLLLLSGKEKNVFVVGDDDQSIYGFRGARPEFLLRFPQDYKETEQVVLDINYRSTHRIIRFATKIIGNNHLRYSKEQHGVGEEGGKILLIRTGNIGAEAEKVADKIEVLHQENVSYDEMAVIFRTNVQSGQFVNAFMGRGIPYTLKDKGNNIFSHWVMKDILAYMQLAQEEENNAAFLRIVNKPKRYVSKELLGKVGRMSYPLLQGLFMSSELEQWQAKPLVELQQHLKQIRQKKPCDAIKYIRNIVDYDQYLADYAAYRRGSLSGLKEIAEEILEISKNTEDFSSFYQKVVEMDASMKAGNKVASKGVKKGVIISTMHSAKGLEFDTVFIPGLNEGIVPHEKSCRPEEVEEERRLFYVAVTRAKKRVFLLECLSRHEKKTKPSSFLKELGL